MSSNEKWKEKYPYRIQLDIDAETKALLEKERSRIGYDISISSVARGTLKKALQWIHAQNKGPIAGNGTIKKPGRKALQAESHRIYEGLVAELYEEEKVSRVVSPE